MYDEHTYGFIKQEREECEVLDALDDKFDALKGTQPVRPTAQPQS